MTRSRSHCSSSIAFTVASRFASAVASLTTSVLAALLIVFGCLGAFSGSALAQNPVPFVNLPLVPDATAPGGPEFTLTVNGTGFVSGAVVDWNGSLLATQFVSRSQLTATVPAAYVASAGTASVTVVNPSPGGGRSNVAFFTVTPSSSSVALVATASPISITNPGPVTVADLNGDGKLDLVVSNESDGTVSILLGDGTGNFTLASSPAAGSYPGVVAVGDFNGDGIPDLAVATRNSNSVSGMVAIFLGDGTGNFTWASSVSSGPFDTPVALAVGDFNGDGKLDLAAVNGDDGSVAILLGDGNGNFSLASTPVGPSFPEEGTNGLIGVGDFNGDGNLDLAVLDGGSKVLILLGDGTGNFKLASSPATGSFPSSLVVGDFNADGRLDLAVGNGGDRTVSILLGDGTGNFTLASTPAGAGGGPLALGDFNADGKLDLAVINYANAINTACILLGDGTGGFTLASCSDTGEKTSSIAVGDFNGDGRLDVAVTNSGNNTVSILLQGSTATLAPGSLSFGTQLVSTTSGPQLLTLTNSGSLPATITEIAVSGDFAETNTCGGSLAAGASCTISVTFSPLGPGIRPGTVTIADNAPGSPQTASLTGSGVISGPNATLSPASLTFPYQLIHATSPAEILTLTNFGTTALSVGSVTASGDFAETNTCGSSVASGASCTISVTFTPTQEGTRTGSVTITDNAAGGPQIASLTGSGVLGENPVPFIDPPLTPDAAAPGGPQFTLTLRGTGFVSGSVVDWDGAPLVTQFVSSSQLTVTVPVSYFDTAGTAWVTVVNPAPGGGGSNIAYFSIAAPTSAVAWTASELTTGNTPISVIAADFNGDGRQDLAVTNLSDGTVSIWLGNQNGTFQPRVDYPAGSQPWSIVAGDFNGDGKQDLVVSSFGGQVSILMGNGDGSFQAPVSYNVSSSTGIMPLAVGDFNGDGRLDVVAGGTWPNTFSILFGNGDGSFQSPVNFGANDGCLSPSTTVGDLNNDGIPDLAFLCGSIQVYLGNGDGTFQSPRQTPLFFSSLAGGAFADWNGDGQLDAVVLDSEEHCGGEDGVPGPACTQFYFVPGNGDGTFGSPSTAGESALPWYSPGLFVSLTVGDFNSDGKLDVCGSSGDLFLGNGDGTFQAPVGVPAPGSTYGPAAAADFNGDGRLDLAVLDTYFPANTLYILLQLAPGSPLLAISTTSVGFGPQSVGTTSGAQSVTLTNTGNAPVTITSIAASGDFAQTNTCGSSVAASTSCTISITFTPTAEGNRTGAITVTDNAPGSPQVVTLMGTGMGPAVSFSASTMSVGGQVVGTTSGAHTVTLTNSGTGTLAIASVAASGDFSETNTCGKSVAAGASCTISVTFAPTAAGTRSGTITITDNAPGSPHVVTLTGTGMGPAVSFNASTMSVGGEIVGTTSSAHTVTLTNSGNEALTITGMTISPASFSQTNTCGSSLATGASCTVTVTFTPATAGAISGVLSIADNAPGSPQEVTLSGVGQDFDIGPYNLLQTVPPGVSAPYDLKLTPVGGFSETVSLACSGAPVQSTCSVSPASVTLNGFNYAAVELKVTTQGAANAPPMKNQPPGSPGPVGLPGVWLAALLGIGLLVIAWRLKTLAPLRLRIAAALSALLLLTIAWIACGGGPAFVYTPPGGGTPAGNYVITVTATSGHLSHAVTVKLTVE